MIADQYREIERRLAAVTEEAEAEAKEILAHVYECSFSALVMRFLHEGGHETELDGIVRARLLGMPLAYVLRTKNFYGYDFYVDECVLIPRSDTEQVVECAVQAIEQNEYKTALDLCCGSGCVGVTLLLESSIRKVCFSDISSEALAVAEKNARMLAPDREMEFLCGDLLCPVQSQVDIIVCNPPYIGAEEYEKLDAQVRGYEPRGALLAEREGYAFYERLAQECSAYLEVGGMVVLEVGCTQQEEVAWLLKSAGFDKINCGFDLAGRPRFVSGVRKG